MKKTHASVFILAFAGFLLSSCESTSNMSITKRHYRNGYYLERTNPNIQMQKMQQTRVLPGERNIKPSNELKLTSGQNRIQPTKNNPETPLGQIKKVKTSIYTIDNAGKTINEINTPAKGIRENKSIFNKNKIATHKIHDGEESNGLGGLLWIIIIVLVILWALSYPLGGFGVGGLIYLLLVIALILLILRLLGTV